MTRLVLTLALLCAVSVPAAFSATKDEGQVILHMNYRISLTGKPRQVKFVTVFPRDLQGQQTIVSVDGGKIPPRKFYKVEDNRYAEYEFVSPSGRTDLEIAVKMELFETDYFLMSKHRNADFLGESYLRPYLRAENGIEKDDPSVSNAAAGITGTNDIDTIRQLYYFVVSNITLKDEVTNYPGAVATLAKKSGNASGYADLFTALCRAKGIPARTVEGFYVKPRGTDPRHQWTEVYIERYGWVSFDPAGEAAGNATFERLKNNYIRLSVIRNDAAIADAHYFQSYAQGEGAVSQVEELYYIE